MMQPTVIIRTAVSCVQVQPGFVAAVSQKPEARALLNRPSLDFSDEDLRMARRAAWLVEHGQISSDADGLSNAQVYEWLHAALSRANQLATRHGSAEPPELYPAEVITALGSFLSDPNSDEERSIAETRLGKWLSARGGDLETARGIVAALPDAVRRGRLASFGLVRWRDAEVVLATDVRQALAEPIPPEVPDALRERMVRARKSRRAQVVANKLEWKAIECLRRAQAALDEASSRIRLARRVRGAVQDLYFVGGAIDSELPPYWATVARRAVHSLLRHLGDTDGGSLRGLIESERRLLVDDALLDLRDIGIPMEWIAFLVEEFPNIQTLHVRRIEQRMRRARRRRKVFDEVVGTPDPVGH